jgi:uncharacterized protein (TIGR03086 family)
MSDGEGLQVAARSDTEIVMTRTFDAPPEVVFDAWTVPELLKRWYGRHGWTLVECDIDLRVGGTWRYVSHGPDGAVMISHGVYREIERPWRLVSTEIAGDVGGSDEESVVTMVLDADGDTTRFTSTIRFPSPAVRDLMLRSPMEEGASEGFDRLDALLDAPRIAARYRRVSGRFAEIIAATENDAWSNPSPCEEWDARGVVRHNVDMAVFVLGLNRLSVDGDAPSVDDDPAGAWAAAREAVTSALEDPDLATREHEWHRHLGQGPWNRAVDLVLSSDLVIHNWDLATAIGVDERIDPGELEDFPDQLDDIDDSALRAPEVYGPALTAPAGSDRQTQLLAFLGRKAW